MLFAFNIVSICLYRFLLSQLKISSKQKDIIFLIICSIQFAFIVGTRTFNTGADTYAYYNIFNTIKNYPNPFLMPKQSQEFIFILLAWTIGRLGFSFVAFNIVIAALTMLILSVSIYKLSINVFWSIYLFYCFSLVNQMMNQYRQILALTIFLYSLSCWIENKKIKCFIFLIVGAGFHVSVLVTIPFLLLLKIKVNKKTVFIYLIAVIIALIFSNAFMYIISLTPYSGYIDSFYNVKGQGSVIANTFVRVILLLFCLYFYSYISKNSSYDYLYHMALWCTSFQILAINSALFGRITTYFYLGYLFLIPEVIEHGFKKKNNKIIAKIVFFIIFIAYYLVYNSAIDIKMNYSNILFD